MPEPWMEPRLDSVGAKCLDLDVGLCFGLEFKLWLNLLLGSPGLWLPSVLGLVKNKCLGFALGLRFGLDLD